MRGTVDTNRAPRKDHGESIAVLLDAAEHSIFAGVESGEVERDVRNRRWQPAQRDRAARRARRAVHAGGQWRVERARVSNEEEPESDFGRRLASPGAKLK